MGSRSPRIGREGVVGWLFSASSGGSFPLRKLRHLMDSYAPS
jgi:hypothetical protein